MNSAREMDRMLSLCQMIHRLAANFRLEVFTKLPQFGQLLQMIIQQASMAIQQAVDDIGSWEMEIFDELLETWVLFVNQSEQLAERSGSQSAMDQGLLRNGSRMIVEAYVKARVSECCADGDDDIEEFMEDGKDRETFEDQLISIGALSRFDLGAILGFLGSQLNEQYLLVQQQIAARSDQLGEAFEKIHWALLIAGHALADAGKGETPTIPQAVDNLPSVEPVTSLVNSSLEFLGWLLQSGQAQRASPLTIETLFWFLQRWSRTFIFFDYVSGTNSFPKWQTVYASGSLTAQSLLVSLVSALHTSLFTFSAEAEVVATVASLLEGLVSNRAVCTFLVGPAGEACWSLLAQSITQKLHLVPDLVHCSLVAILIRAGCGFNSNTNDLQRSAYINMTLSMIGQRWEGLLGRPDFHQIYQQSSVSSQLLNCLDMFCGVADAVEPHNQTFLLKFLAKYFDSMLSCLALYKVGSYLIADELIFNPT